MADSYSVKAVLSAVDRGFSSTLKGASGSVDSLASKIKSGLGFGVLTGVGQQAFSSLMNGARGLVGELNSSNMAWKTFAGNMQIMGKGEAEINSVKKELQSFAEQTIYSASDMAQTYAQLAAVGTKNTASLVKGFGGLASAAENPQQAMKTLSQQATQMAARPTVAWQDFKLMLEQSPAGMAAVAKQMGMTTSELVSGIQDGKVSTEEFFNAIEKVGTSDAFTDLATQYKSAGQAMSGLTETLSNKLGPAFEVLNSIATGGISGITDKISKLDGEKIAAKVSGWVKKAQPLIDDFKKGLSKVGEIGANVAKYIGPKFKEMGASIGNTVKKISQWFASIDVKSVSAKITAFLDSLEPFRAAFKEVGAEVWQGLGQALKAVISVLPKITQFFNDNKETISKVLPWIIRAVLAFKGFQLLQSICPLFGTLTNAIGGLVKGGISKLAGKFASTGSEAAASGSDMLKASAGYLMMGAAVLLVSLGFALLAQSAIALANAGGGAIGMMAGLVIAVVGIGVGMAFLMKTLAPMSGQLVSVGAAFLMMGAAVLLIGAGFGLLAMSAIALANAGWPAIAVMLGLVVAIVALGVAAALGGSMMTAGAVGMIAFGAAVLLVGAGLLLASLALAVVCAQLPLIAAYGASAAIGFLQLGAGLAIFAIGALAAGLSCIVLGTGLLLIATAVLLVATGFLLIATGALLAASAIALLSLVLPTVVQYGTSGAIALAVLSVGLLAFGLAAGVAGIAALALGVALTIVGGALILIATAILMTASAIALIAVVMPLLAQHGLTAALGLAVFSAALLVFAGAAAVAGAGALVLSIGLLALGIAIITLGAGLVTMALGGAAAAGAIALLNLVLPQLAAHATQSMLALIQLSMGLIAFGTGALAAGAGVLVFSAAVLTLGLAMTTASVGMLLMMVAVKGVATSVKSIAKNAKSAEKSLKGMQKSVSTVESGIKAIGSVAKSAMSKLVSAFDNTQSKMQASGRKLAESFVKSMQSGLNMAPMVAMAALVMVAGALKSGYSQAFAAGAYVSQGFAAGMRSCLGQIRIAAAQMAAAADKAARAKLKIKSPSRVAEESAGYYGEGWINKLNDMKRKVWDAAESLVTMPSLATPDLALAYAGEMSSDYSYYRNTEYTIVVPVEIDGKEVARSTAPYTEAELNTRQKREDRKNGRR